MIRKDRVGSIPAPGTNIHARRGLRMEASHDEERRADGASVVEHVLKGKGHEVSFGQITEIRRVTLAG